MAFGPDIEHINPYSNLSQRVTAAESGKDRKGKRRREQHPEEPEDVLDLHEEDPDAPESPGVELDADEADGLDLSA